jgi:hypothetical protein
LWRLRIGADPNVSVLLHETGARLTNSWVDGIAATPDGHIAIGTDRGFNLLDPATDSVERIQADPSAPGGLDEGYVPAFANDRHGRLWVGTSNGLDILEGRDDTGRPRFRRLGVADGLPNASIDDLQVDRQGRIWASTDNGLAVIDPETFKVRALQRADGVAITNYWADSGAVMPTGEVVFGGVGGVTIVAESAVESWHFRPPVVITAARVGGKPVPVGAGAASTLTVPADANSLAVEFAALDFSSPARNRYSYRLDGFDSGWIETDAAHRVAAYTNLPPGNYQLRLRGSNRNSGAAGLVSDLLVPAGGCRGRRSSGARADACFDGDSAPAAAIPGTAGGGADSGALDQPAQAAERQCRTRKTRGRTNARPGRTHTGPGIERSALPGLVQQCRRRGIRGASGARWAVCL